MSNAFKASIAVLAVSACSTTPSFSDPKSGRIDPPPAPLNYVASFPKDRWVFGRLLWRSPEACTANGCEAAYNAAPLFLLVSKQQLCCGSPGYSLMIQANVQDCPSVTYYVVASKDVERLKEDKVAFVARKVRSLASSIVSACKAPDGAAIPTEPLKLLFEQSDNG